MELVGLLGREGLMQLSASERQKGTEALTDREAVKYFLSVVIVVP